MEKQRGDDEETASPAQFGRQVSEEHREDNAGDRRAASCESEGEWTVTLHPRTQHHEGCDVRGGAAQEADDALNKDEVGHIVTIDHCMRLW